MNAKPNSPASVRRSRSGPRYARLAVAILVALSVPAGAALAASFTDFESGYTTGATVNGQTAKNVPYGTHVYGSTWTVVDEWGNGRITDPAKPDFDERVVDDGTGNIVWRVSDAVSDSGYSDQPNTPSSPAVAGETGAGLWNDRGGVHTAPAAPVVRATATTKFFNHGFRFKSATGAAQTGLALRLSAVPRQSSTRITWLEIKDNGAGFDLSFIDVDSTGAGFPTTVIATGLSYTAWHSIDMFIEFADGVNMDGSGNDIVRIVIDGVLVHTGTTWETYYSHLASPKLYAVDAVMHRISTANPADAGNGLFLDDVVVDNQPYPTCGDEIVAPRPLYVPGGVGEQCDTGVDNGTFGSCCSSVCAFEADTVACSTASGGCDTPDNCTGSSEACPDAIEPAATVCRASAGVCDPTEVCDGVSKACPADTLIASGVTCRESAGVCDTAEACDGANPACPADVLVPAATVCRSSAGSCDIVEACTGSDALCPGDIVEPDSVVCRPSAGVCDLDENCTGTSGACPADAKRPNDYLCRAAVDADCDVPDYCTGADAACPVDAVEPNTTHCTEDSEECTDDRCDGGGYCSHPPIPLAPECYWLAVGGSDTRAGEVRSLNNAQVHGRACADKLRVGDSSDITASPRGASWVALETTGIAAQVHPDATLVDGSLLTGGGCVEGRRNASIFDTGPGPICCADSPVELPGGNPLNVIDACGMDPLVDECADAKARVPFDIAYLNALPSDQNLGFVSVAPTQTYTIVAGPGVNVVDIDKLKMNQNSTLRIDAQGNADAVVVLRLARGLLTRKLSNIVLAGGATAANVLFYGRDGKCIVAKSNVGNGTLFCPNGRVKLRIDTMWTGALGGGNLVEIGWNVDLTHVPFLGLALY